MSSQSSKSRTDNEGQDKQLHGTQDILQSPSNSRGHGVNTHSKCRGCNVQSPELPCRRFLPGGFEEIRRGCDGVTRRDLLSRVSGKLYRGNWESERLWLTQKDTVKQIYTCHEQLWRERSLKVDFYSPRARDTRAEF